MQNENGGRFMKVVLIKIPKVFGGILRLIFGIKKQNV
ncbi:MAG: stage V sporulation protein SpoVM [Clostridia bacterium]|nr:stage V sporulation protein SpoVM [Clostridia bacterium]